MSLKVRDVKGKLVILGSGLDGLLAAAAAFNWGTDVRIVGPAQKSKIDRAHFMTDFIPGYGKWSKPDGQISYVKRGRRKAYALKVYGDQDASCSWRAVERGRRPVWSASDLYDQMWVDYSQWIIDAPLSAAIIDGIYRSADLVISAIPAPLLCSERGSLADHVFYGRQLYVSPIAEAGTRKNSVIYNGTTDGDWHRSGKIFDGEFTESSSFLPRSRQVTKPTGNTCSCRPEIVRVGKLGQWRSGVRSHDPYFAVTAEMDSPSLISI